MRWPSSRRPPQRCCSCGGWRRKRCGRHGCSSAGKRLSDGITGCWQRCWQAFALLGAGVLIGWDGWSLYQARAQAEARQQELARLLPQKQQMEALEQLRSELERKEQRWQGLTQAGFPWYGLLVHLGAMTVDGVWLEGIELRDQDVLEIEGQAVSYEAIADFVQVFERDKDFFPEGPVLESSGDTAEGKQPRAGGTVVFRLALHL